MTRLRPKKLIFSRDTIKVLDSAQLSQVYSGLQYGGTGQPAPLLPGTMVGCDVTVEAEA
jgi:hypothetical protein